MINEVKVGSSKSRTPLKHSILDCVLGEQVGALSTGKLPCERPLLIIDMCAGDGVDSEESEACSPGIIKKHLNFHAGRDNRAILCEVQRSTFMLLKKNYGDQPRMELVNDTSKGMDVSRFMDSPRQAVFIYADPNSMAQMPITEKFIDNLPKFASLVLTLGCNAAGIKRLKAEERAEWYAVKTLAEQVPSWHDSVLIWLKKDSSQWAYLVCVPTQWAKRQEKTILNKADKLWAKGAGAVSLRRSPRHEWNQQWDELFKTKKELVT